MTGKVPVVVYPTAVEIVTTAVGWFAHTAECQRSEVQDGDCPLALAREDPAKRVIHCTSDELRRFRECFNWASLLTADQPPPLTIGQRSSVNAQRKALGLVPLS